jgi:hypothetical protein
LIRHFSSARSSFRLLQRQPRPSPA